jgi:hypothetical protein
MSEGLIAALPHGDKSVVTQHAPEDDGNDEAKNDPCRRGHRLGSSTTPAFFKLSVLKPQCLFGG